MQGFVWKKWVRSTLDSYALQTSFVKNTVPNRVKRKPCRMQISDLQDFFLARARGSLNEFGAFRLCF